MVASPDVVFTARTEPCAVTIHVGVTIHIVLDTGFNWSDPKSDSSAVQVTHIRRPSAGGGLRADLEAVAVGETTVTSGGGVACRPGQPCPMLYRLWRLNVMVAGIVPSTTVTVTEADSGKSISLRKGDGLDVELSGPSNYTWTVPMSSNPGVLQPVSAKAGSANLLAVGAGVATVQATDNPNCYPQCLPPSRLFQISVTVPG